jgi:C-terminal processing protease CtpA/Prc
MATSTGAGFSQGFPLTDPALCDNIGQIYQGPVVLITDALCYSTTDIFAAGFQDHGLGTVLGVHANTGAGGANVWTHDEVLQRLTLKPNPFVRLPAGAGMRVAARRSMRVGVRAGVPLEDLGVEPDERHQMTRDDLLKGNVDLIAHAAAILKKKETQGLQLSTSEAALFSEIQVKAANIDRVDLFVDNRPVASVDVSSAPKTIKLPSAATGKNLVEAFGYRGGTLVVRTRLAS